jgi:hypothetical protein
MVTARQLVARTRSATKGGFKQQRLFAGISQWNVATYCSWLPYGPVGARFAPSLIPYLQMVRSAIKTTNARQCVNGRIGSFCCCSHERQVRRIECRSLTSSTRVNCACCCSHERQVRRIECRSLTSSTRVNCAVVPVSQRCDGSGKLSHQQLMKGVSASADRLKASTLSTTKG